MQSRYTPLLQRVPLWVAGRRHARRRLPIYVLFNFSLAGSSDIAFNERQQLAAARRHRRAAHAVAAAAVAPAPAPLPAQPVAAASPAASKLQQFLAPEIKAGLVSVLEDPQAITVRLTNATCSGPGRRR